eukprot:12419585-Karenia_brevis.AAC.1
MKLSEILKEMCQMKCSHVIQASPVSPVLSVYMADGTPCKIKSECVILPTTFDSRPLRRHGHTLVEFYLERAFFLRKDLTGALHRACLLRDPKRISHEGHAGWLKFLALQEFMPLLPRVHDQGIAVSAYVFDRGGVFFTGTQDTTTSRSPSQQQEGRAGGIRAYSL